MHEAEQATQQSIDQDQDKIGPKWFKVAQNDKKVQHVTSDWSKSCPK